jgi:hypothetical protein
MSLDVQAARQFFGSVRFERHDIYPMTGFQVLRLRVEIEVNGSTMRTR